ncbi:PAS domain-containing protein [Sulfurimonas sp. SAG-AH-194-L11]|nr:PAS domain-containing protein [Sulfurimonas sp. SAG-AH-194-L11]MDF1877708.1 PAS domain-containing protein [Sulfurimonas sp. SAG-AH-194-L11]
MSAPTPTNTEKQLSVDEFIVSKTDERGKILYGNKTFIKISGYNEEELLGKPHSILRHPDMPKVVFQLLWDRLKEKKEIFAYVKNLCKDGSFYWVYANVTVTLDKDAKVIDLHSVRRKPSRASMKVIPGLYKLLLEKEKSAGVGASQKLLNDTLQDMGESYDDFIFNLQH